MRVRVVLGGILLLFLSVPPALSLPANPGTQASCEDAPTPQPFASWPTQLENLAFDGAGALYVSDLGGKRLLKLDPSAATSVVAPLPIHGLTFGPDGLLYVGVNAAESAQVWRFDSLGTAPSHTVVASGLLLANGMAFDAAGNLFVSNPGLGEGAPYLARLPADDMAAWSTWGTQYGPNGLWRDADGSLLAAITADQSSPIVRWSTSDASDVSVVAQLSFGAVTLEPGAHAPSGPLAPAPKGLDDLTLGPDGMIYAAGAPHGEIMRVDPNTGEACVLASGFEEPTSVRFASGFGPYDGQLFVTDMGGEAVTALFGPGAGAVWRLDLG